MATTPNSGGPTTRRAVQGIKNLGFDTDFKVSTVELLGHDSSGGVLRRIQVDSDGKLKVDMSSINLNDLADVNAPSPSDDDSLTWDAATSKWVPQAISGGAGADVKVAVDSAATAGYLGAASNDGVLRVSAPISYTDGGDFVTLGISADGIKDTHIDWGTGAGQVSAVDMPIADAGTLITATEVEGALQENRTAINLNTTHRSSDGSDHTFIDQSVVSGASPTFDGANFTGLLVTALSGTKAEFDAACSDGNFAYAGGAFHDGFSDFVANEHIDHTSVTLTAGVGLSGGGDISANRTFTLDLNELTTETTIASGDFIAMVDITDNGSGKITFANFEGTIDHDNLTNTHNLTTDIDHDQLTNFVAGEHFLQTAITNVSTALSTGLLKVTTGTGALSSITDNSSDWDTAYTHSQDNSQAHSDYLINNGDDTTSGTLTAAGFTDGTATLTGGNLTSIGAIGASGDADLLSLASGALTVNGNLDVGSGTPSSDRTLNVTSTSSDVVALFETTNAGVNAYSIVDVANTSGTDTLGMIRLRNDATGWSIGIDSDDTYKISHSAGGSFASPVVTVSGYAGSGIVTVDGDLRVDGGDIGLTADNDLLQLASGALTVNGTGTFTGDVGIGGNLTLGSSGAGEKLITWHSDVAGAYVDARNYGDYFIIYPPAGTANFGMYLRTGTGGNMGFDVGGNLLVRDRDASYATRLTVDSATGSITSSGLHYFGDTNVRIGEFGTNHLQAYAAGGNFYMFNGLAFQLANSDNSGYTRLDENELTPHTDSSFVIGSSTKALARISTDEIGAYGDNDLLQLASGALTINGTATTTGDATVGDILFLHGRASSDQGSYNRSYEILRAPGTTSDFIMAIQDGTGRVQFYWNSTVGSSPKFLVGGEDAAKMLIDTSGQWTFYRDEGGAASAGDAISWDAILTLGQTDIIAYEDVRPDADSSNDLGTSSYYWANAYIDTIHLNDKITKYNGVATEGYGVPAIVDRAGYTNRTTAVGSTTMSNTGTAGEYRVNVYLSGNGSTGASPSCSITINWTDTSGARTKTLTLSGPGNYDTLVLPIKTVSGSITYSTTINNINYDLYVQCERLN